MNQPSIAEIGSTPTNQYRPQSQDKLDTLSAHIRPAKSNEANISPLHTNLARNLHFDVLSTIFVSLSFEDALCTLHVSAVCRHWRQVALTTLEAWCTISQAIYSHSNRLKLYLERSGRAPLHVDMQRTKDQIDAQPELSMLMKEKERIQCLTIRGQCYLLRHSFPNLQKLVLDSDHLSREALFVDSGDDSPETFILRRFPRIKVLELVGYTPAWLINALWSSPTLPPLQRLALYLILPGKPSVKFHPPSWANSLISLTVRTPGGTIHNERLTLPRLRYIQIIEPPGLTSDASIDLDAPRLESVHYVYGTSVRSSPQLILRNEQTVKYLHTSRVSDMSQYPGLRCLWLARLFRSEDWIISQLKAGVQFCPRLEVIRFVHHNYDGYRDYGAIISALITSRSPLKLLICTPDVAVLPGSAIKAGPACY